MRDSRVSASWRTGCTPRHRFISCLTTPTRACRRRPAPAAVQRTCGRSRSRGPGPSGPGWSMGRAPAARMRSALDAALEESATHSPLGSAGRRRSGFHGDSCGRFMTIGLASPCPSSTSRSWSPERSSGLCSMHVREFLGGLRRWLPSAALGSTTLRRRSAAQGESVLSEI